MELVYVWVDDFRNIVQQGFNFGSKGWFKYKNNVLRFIPNENYMEGFFHENVTSITGVVGRNGTGKTNILELLMYISRKSSYIKMPNFFLLVQNGNDLEVICNGMNPDTSRLRKFDNVEVSKFDGGLKYFTPVYFSNVYDNRKNKFATEVLDLTTNNFGHNSFGENLHSYQQADIRNQVNFIGSDAFKKMKIDELEVPYEIVFSSSIWQSLQNKARRYDYDYGFYGLQEFLRNYRMRFVRSRNREVFFPFVTFQLFIHLIFDPIWKEEISREMRRSRDHHFNPDQIKRFRDFFEEAKGRNTSVWQLNDLIIDFLHRFFKETDSSGVSLVEFMRYELGSRSDASWVQDKFSQGKSSQGRLEFTLNFRDSRKCRSFVKNFLNATHNNRIFNLDWGGISSGQKAFLTLFSRFHSKIKSVRQKNVLICIDEGELYLHPKWQLTFVNSVIQMLTEIFGDRKLQLILTSHSPFIVSDLPKSNLILLDNVEGKCIVKRNDKVDLETFGGNIHMLFTKAFFLDNGTVSDFAYKKLREIIAKIESDQYDRIELLKVINQIGEPILKRELLKKMS